MSSNQRPDTLMQGHVCQIDENLLQRTAGPYIGVKTHPSTTSTQCQDYPRERTIPPRHPMSQKCQERL